MGRCSHHQELYQGELLNTKFIPILLDPKEVSHVPIILKGTTFYDVSTEAGYTRLYRRLTGQPETEPPSVAEKFRDMPPVNVIAEARLAEAREKLKAAKLEFDQNEFGAAARCTSAAESLSFTFQPPQISSAGSPKRRQSFPIWIAQAIPHEQTERRTVAADAGLVARFRPAGRVPKLTPRAALSICTSPRTPAEHFIGSDDSLWPRQSSPNSSGPRQGPPDRSPTETSILSRPFCVTGSVAGFVPAACRPANCTR